MTEAEWNASTDPVAMLDWLAQHHKPSDRKLRLAACAFVRQVWHLLDDTRSKTAVIVAEKFADHLATADELAAAASGATAGAATAGAAAAWAAAGAAAGAGARYAAWAAARAAAAAASKAAAGAAAREKQAGILRDIIGNPFRPVTLPMGEECEECAPRRRWQETWCVVCHGTGHGPSPVLTPLVKSLAEAAYQERDPSGTLDPFRLGLLSDALEEAGVPTDETCCRCGGTGSLGGGRKVPASRTKLCDACGGRLQLPHPLLAHLREPGPHYRGCFAIDLLTGRN